jgi:hypothetical protein
MEAVKGSPRLPTTAVEFGHIDPSPGVHRTLVALGYVGRPSRHHVVDGRAAIGRHDDAAASGVAGNSFGCEDHRAAALPLEGSQLPLSRVA